MTLRTPAALAFTVLLAAALAGCTAKDPIVLEAQVRFETSLGNFTLETRPDVAPRTVENFLRYVDDGFYDGVTFHRISPGFVVQGGGYLPDGTPREPTRPPVRNEASLNATNEPWTVAMARRTDPDSATTQFFVNLVRNPRLDPGGYTSAGYAVFANVTEGRETLTAMTQQQPGRVLDEGGWEPATPIIIHRAYRL